MMKLTIVGNLGSDAQLRREQGNEFVSLSIAHSEKRKDESGNEYERTEWISATINGNAGNLLPYLKKGTKVYAYGDISLRTFHSEKERKLKAGLNLFIRNIELVGAQPDIVPRELYEIDGCAHKVGKWFYCDTIRNAKLYDRNGVEFVVDENGWVHSVQATEETQSAQTTEKGNEDTNNTDNE